MATRKTKKKSGKAKIFMLLPVVIVLFIVGWCMYWIGDQKSTNKPKPLSPRKQKAKEDNVTIMAINPEEIEEIKTA